ncbi:MAG: sulfite exporter TauE/SafE family protein [Acidimicrobiia bacterium]|nr:sulfite exporter TauE/SafE family protein [Acidimicrobiia bacterium]
MPRTALGLVLGLSLGLAAGVVGGLFGVGGGVVLVPGMVVLLGVAQHTAHGTSVAAIIASATSGAARLGIDGEVDWDVAGIVLVGAVVGAFLGARAMNRIPAVWLARAFVVVAIVAAARMAFQPEITGALLAERGAVTTIGFVALGLAAGTLAAILGVGGGIVYVPALVALFAFPQHIAQGTSLAIIVPSMVVAAITHSRAGRVDWGLGAVLGLGGVVGGLVGAEIALSLDALLLRRLFAAFLVLMVLRMLHKTRSAAHQPI